AVLLRDAPARARGRTRGVSHGAHHRPRGHEQHLLVPGPPAPLPARPAHPGRRLLRAADRVVTRRTGPEALDAGARAVLDVRDDAAFAAGHLAGSGHVPRSELGTRRAELPPRARALLGAA